MKNPFSLFFKRYQKQLLDLIGQPYARSYFHIPERERVVCITPNAYHIELDKGVYKGIFRTYDLFADRLMADASITAYISRKIHRLEPFFYLPMLSTDSFTASTNDAEFVMSNEATWAAARGATSADSFNASGSAATIEATFDGANFDLSRVCFDWDTSSIPDSNSIFLGATKIAANGVVTNADTSTVEIVPGAQAIPPTGADIDDLTFTSLSSVALAGIVNVAGSYQSFTLNQTGLAAISKTGTTKQFAIIGRDLNNAQPAGQNNWTIRMRDDSGSSTDPLLEVTHATAGGAFLYGFL